MGPLIGLIFAVAPGGTEAQTGDLRTDLADLNIRHRTEHYAIAGTVTDDRLVEYGRCLEYIYQEYATGFSGLLEQSNNQTGTAGVGKQARRRSVRDRRTVERSDRPESPPPEQLFKVVILATDAQYAEFGQAYFGERAEHTRGMFVPAAELLLIRDEPASRQTYEVLFHEAFHQFAHRHVLFIPVWLNEGLATYYGTARPTKSGLAFDQPRVWYFGVVKDARAVGKLIPLDELMLSDASTFYDREPIAGLSHDRTTLSYAQSYTLVAYMLNDRHGPDHLRKYIRALAGAGSRAAARQVTQRHFEDKLLDAMVPPWLDYVNRR
jgi:hypothetical protein